MRVIDCHFHWYPREHFERLTKHDGFPRTERVGEGYKYWFNGGRSFIPLTAAWFDLQTGLEEAGAAGDVAVVATAGVLPGLIDQLPPTVAVPLAQSYNEALAAAERAHRGHVFGTALVPLNDTDAAIELLDEAVKVQGLHGVNLPPVSAGDLIDAPRLESFYDRVEELGVPLIIHPTDLVLDEVLRGYGDGIQRSLGRLVDSSVTMLRLVFSGVMERHPDLKVLHTHGGGVLPYQVGRIDKNARIAGLPLPPSTYIRRTHVDTVAPQELTVRTAGEFYGEDHVHYGTDHPCWSVRAALDVVGAVPLSEQARRRIMFDNSADLFGIRDHVAEVIDHHAHQTFLRGGEAPTVARDEP